MRIRPNRIITRDLDLSGMIKAGVFLVTLLVVEFLHADELKPAYLEILQQSESEISILWKSPDNDKVDLMPKLPAHCSATSPVNIKRGDGASVYRWKMSCESLEGGKIFVTNLANTNTDVLLRLRWLDGTWLTSRITPRDPEILIPETGSQIGIASTYWVLGIEHILLGFDHLLFVFALLLLITGTRQLIVTITAFTLAHSVTLAAATLGFVSVPQQPVEAVIALSIVFLAMEIVHKQQGRLGLASRFPWLVAMLFGLLHGFGFAGALAEIGLPAGSIPLALVFFNLGVECGQLLFVMSLLVINRIVKFTLKPKVELALTYGIGGLASFWLIDRVIAF